MIICFSQQNLNKNKLPSKSCVELDKLVSVFNNNKGAPEVIMLIK